MAKIPRDMSLTDLDRELPRLVDRGLPGGGEFLFADLEENPDAPALVALLIWHGFLPMGGGNMLLLKIHKSRCVLAPESVHVSRKSRRRARGFHLSVDRAWADVVRGIQEHTYTHDSGDCWLTDTLASTYESVNSLSTALRHGVAFHSIELWHTETDKLVAGEIGFTCGSVYSSVTGFAMKEEHPGVGGVQLIALGRWLAHSGFRLWDLGMELNYKLELGGKSVPRAEWAGQIRALRKDSISLRRPDGASARVEGLFAGLPPDPALSSC